MIVTSEVVYLLKKTGKLKAHITAPECCFFPCLTSSLSTTSVHDKYGS